MSTSNIPSDVKTKLWIKSGGRCQYDPCNENLYRDDETMTELNKAYIAHIVADTPGGPRGDSVRSPRLAKDFSNLMLLCDTHHRLIDRDDVAGHPEERLKQMKADHETRIETLTSIRSDKKSTVLLFGARIGAHDFPVHFEKARFAMIPDSYPSEPRGIELGIANVAHADHESEYWRLQGENLKRNFTSKVSDRLRSGEIRKLSVFAIAPQPLLMLLGLLLGDIATAEVFQLHREPADWKWQDHPDRFEFQFYRPENTKHKPALVFSLSDTIQHDRVTSVIGTDTSIWTLSIEKPNNDFLKSKTQLAMFREAVRKALRDIKAAHGESAMLHIFPAMPVACAVEFGRVVMPKADISMKLYDQNKTHGRFIETFDLTL